MENAHYYTTTINWKEGRIGEINSKNFTPITVATPPEFPKGVEGLWSPEHLFIASANICLMTTFLAIAENSKYDFVAFEAEATGKLEKVENNFMISEIVIKPKLTIKDEAQKERGIRLLEKSEERCLISNSMKTKVHLEPIVIINNNLT